MSDMLAAVSVLCIVILLLIVVSEYLRRTGELRTKMGRVVLNILLLQDVLVAPAFAIFQLIGRHSAEWGILMASGAGCLGLIFLLRAIRRRNVWAWSGWGSLEGDHDLQVFVGCGLSVAGAPMEKEPLCGRHVLANRGTGDAGLCGRV